jgi:hypothetical protein
MYRILLSMLLLTGALYICSDNDNLWSNLQPVFAPNCPNGCLAMVLGPITNMTKLLGNEISEVKSNGNKYLLIKNNTNHLNKNESNLDIHTKDCHSDNIERWDNIVFAINN